MTETTTTTTTPATAPAAPPAAAPATSAPATPSSPGERPTTFAEAFARDAAVSETPAADDGTATTAPSSETPDDTAPPTPGEPPREKWETILNNAREKAKQEATKEFQQQYGWAQGVDRAAVEEAARMGQLYQQDRPGFIRQMLAEALTDADLAPLVRSEAARVLANRTRGTQPEAQPAPDLSPDIPVLDAEGRVVTQTYSAERVQQIVQQAISDAIGKELAPLKQDYQTRQQREQAIQQQQALQQQSESIYADALETLPGFKEHEASIAEAFNAIPASVPADRALRMAWKQVVGDKLANADQVKAQTITDLKTKAAASTVNPATAGIATTKRPTSFHDASLSWS